MKDQTIKVPTHIMLEFRFTKNRFNEVYEKISRAETLLEQNQLFETHKQEWNQLVKKLCGFFEKYQLS